MVSPEAIDFSFFFTLEGQGDWVALLFLWVQKRLTSFSPVSRFYIEVCILGKNRNGKRFLLDSVECFAEIVDDIVNMLCTDRKSDSVWLDTLICKLCFVKLCVCC